MRAHPGGADLALPIPETGRGCGVARRISAFLCAPAKHRIMSFEKDDEVVLRDKHSEYDGEAGTITQVMETMFGDALERAGDADDE
jgi:hypothetical protein